MIKLPYGYAIDTSEYGGYIFGKLFKTKVKTKNGFVIKEIISKPIYPATIEDCLLRLFQILESKKINTEDLSLESYLEKIKKIQQEFLTELKKIVEKV